MIGNTASIYGSYMYPASAAPQYIPGGSANTVICLVVGLLALLLRFVHIRENKKLEAAEREIEGRSEQPGKEADAGKGVDDDAGMAGRRAVGFRYVY